MYNDQVGAFLSNPDKKTERNWGGGISKGSFKHKGPSHFLTCLIHTQCRRPALAPKPLSKPCLSFVPLTVSTLLGSFLPSNQDAFLTALTCKVLIAGPRGTTFIPGILIRRRRRHMGAKKETARPCKEVAPDKTTRPGCLSLSFARPLQTLRVTAAVWPVLETKTEWLQAAYDGCGHPADTIKTHFYSFPQSHNLGCLFFMMVERGGLSFWEMC